MNNLRVNAIDYYQNDLLGYNLIGNKIIYLTQSELCTMRVGGKVRKECIKIKGSNILNFVISKRGYIAFLMKNKTIEIRRMDNLGEVFHKFSNILISAQHNYPRMKWDYQDLYLVYSDSLQILDLKTKKRRGYTDIIVEYEKEQINDIIITNVMDSQKAAILQLNDRLIFTIIPIPITQIPIPSINSVLNLYSPSLTNDSRRQYVAILNNNRTMTILNMLNLKPIVQVDLQAKNNQFLEMETDGNCQCILVRYISSISLQITRNVIYKINSEEYYGQGEDYFKQKSGLFFSYKFEVNITENLTLFPLTFEMYDDELFDYYSLIFFKQGRIYSVLQPIPHSYSQSSTQLKSKTRPQSEQNEQWKQLIQTYLELSSRREQEEGMYEEQRQLHEYNIIKEEFDGIIGRFSKRINETNDKNNLTENSIQKEWDQYMAQIAKERNFMIETMKLFKIQPQIIRKNYAPPLQNTQSELETCMNDIENREKRIDARIQEKKKEIQLEKIEKLKSTQEQIQKYQEDYEKFVAEFMQQTQRKEKQQIQKKGQKLKDTQIDQKFILALPTLTQQQRRLINLAPQPFQLPISQPPQQNPQQTLTQQILFTLQSKMAPLISHLQPLINRLSKLQISGLDRIKKNQEQITSRCSLNLQQIVKNSCKRMLLTLSTRIKNRVELASRSIYELQDKNRRYYQQSIEQFKFYIKHQIANRIELFYRGRKRIQSSLIGMAKDMNYVEQGQQGVKGKDRKGQELIEY